MDRLIHDLIGMPVATTRPLHGGDLSDVTLVTLKDGSPLVAKTGPRVASEGRMLAAMGTTGAPVPCVLAQRDDLLLLEALPEAPPSVESWQALGQGLRILHSATGDSYGWDENYAFGPVPIDNTRLSNWPTFWAERRLRPFLPDLPAKLAHRLAALSDRLPDLLPAHPQAALLHGDLWAGNVLFGPGGAAHMIDPACYHGDAEVDLAMLHLFASPPPAFHDAYGPLSPGWPARRAAYQLWPALVHLSLFGPSYQPMVEARLTTLGA